MSRVLVIGAGLIVKPLLDELLALPEVEVRLAALDVARARALAAGRPRIEAVAVDALDEAQLVPEVARAALVVSLLPAQHHGRIACACLAHGVPLVTTSYVSAEMRALDEEARRRGVLLLNECGLDPGIDHMTAVQLVRRVHREGGRVVGFASFCGGLPAPEARSNPWGYKFTWSPRSVLAATRQPVRFLEEGVEREVSFPDFFAHPRMVDVPGVGMFEGYPNRDSTRYAALYGAGEARHFVRGTLRYPGWCASWRALATLGWLELDTRDWRGTTYASVLDRALPPGPGGLIQRLAAMLEVATDDPLILRLEWLGLLSDRPIEADALSPLDVLASRMQRLLTFEPGERDMIVLDHRLDIETAGGHRRRLTSRLVAYGQAGDDSAMARSVSYPAALACRLILEKRVDLTGVQVPVDASLVEPILLGLERRGLHVEEAETDL